MAAASDMIIEPHILSIPNIMDSMSTAAVWKRRVRRNEDRCLCQIVVQRGEERRAEKMVIPR